MAELDVLFPPAMQPWLRERGCTHAQWIAPGDAGAAGQGCVDFQVDMGPGLSGTGGVRLHFEGTAVLADADRGAVAAYLAAMAPFLREPASGDVDRVVALPRETLLALEHQLRNHLNSLMMNAGALSVLCENEQGLEHYVEQMEREGRNCLEVMRWLTEAGG